MIFVTAAAGPRHRALAEALDRSFARWRWPRLIVVSPEPLDVREWVPGDDDFGRGRGLKTRWATALPTDYEGPCGWIDADCEATGEWSPPDLPPAGTLAGLLGVVYQVEPPFMFFRSTLMLAGDAATARALCGGWSAAFAAQPSRSDEPSLLRAIRRLRIPQIALPGTSGAPLPGLTRLGGLKGVMALEPLILRHRIQKVGTTGFSQFDGGGGA